MQHTLALLSTIVGIASAIPQGVTEELVPNGSPPAGCYHSFGGRFEITVARVTEQKRSIKQGACGTEGTLVLTLDHGITMDAQGRTGYIASNYQFQFDAPPQAGTLFNSGFSICEDLRLALGSSKTFYQCRSGSFYNLYDRTWAEQCEPVSIIAVPCGSEDTVSQSADGQIIGTTVVPTTIITALPDGQPQVITTSANVPIYSTHVPVSEETDGQVQVPTSTPAPPPVPTETITPPPETTTEVVPTETPAPPAPTTSAPEAPPSSSISVPVETPSPSAPESTPEVTPPSSSPSAPATTSSTPPAASVPAEAGSSHVAAGSMGALVVGMVVAFICL